MATLKKENELPRTTPPSLEEKEARIFHRDKLLSHTPYVASSFEATLEVACLLDIIQARTAEGRLLTDIAIELKSFGSTPPKRTQLTQEIWEKKLIVGPWRDTFFPLWELQVAALASRRDTLSALGDEDPGFEQSCKNITRDLRYFEDCMVARGRLESTGCEYFLGAPYFTIEQVGRILGIKTMGGTVKTTLDTLLAGDAENVTRVQAARSLRQLLEFALGTRWDEGAGAEAVDMAVPEIVYKRRYK
ncbi:hypothetical protein B0O99DRAFT_670241 [Bisporella sp. PMI_857]|nr:hypothetical protein B0O99DRAFT_670241 [Bisporella sp. PMI_857]